MTNLSIVIPCYNEQDNLPLIFERFDSAIKKMEGIEVVFVNNGSTDNSAAVLDNLIKKFKFARLTVVRKNQGYGFGILSGLNDARGEVLAWTHADMQTDPEDVLRAYELYKAQKRDRAELFVKGKRKNRRLIEAFFTFGMQVLASAALRVWLEDINAQPKLFSREFYKKYIENRAPFDFSLDLYALYMAMKYAAVAEIPVVFKKRLHGEAKGGGSLKTRIKLMQRTYKYIFELRKKILREEK